MTAELVRDEVAVEDVYAETAVTGTCDFVRAFTINEPVAMGRREIYAGAHGFVPTTGAPRMAEVRSVPGTTLFPDMAVELTLLDPDAAMPNSYAVPTADFDGNPMTDATAMTDGDDLVQAYAVRQSFNGTLSRCPWCPVRRHPG